MNLSEHVLHFKIISVFESLYCFFRLPRGLLSPEELHLLGQNPAKVADTLSRAVGRVVASTDKSQVGPL